MALASAAQEAIWFIENFVNIIMMNKSTGPTLIMEDN